jgi:hypothetical protein
MLLQLLTSLTARDAAQSADRAVGAAATASLDRLTAILSADREAQRTTITHLSANCETLAAAAHALSERAISNTTSLDPAGMSDLSSAIIRLADAVDELRARQSSPADLTLPIPAEPSPLGPARLDLRQELRRLRADLE